MKVLLLTFLACLAAAALAAPVTQPVAVVAHRGLGEGVPENTMAAFRYSAALGVTVIELDLRATRDRQLVVMHDETVDRTTNGHGKVSSLTLAKIRELDAGSHADRRFAGERVPTFADAIAFARSTRTRLLADLKPGTPLNLALDLIGEEGAEDVVILGLRRPKDVARARAQLPTLTTLAFIDTPDQAASFAQAGAHIIRLWSDWIAADPSHIGRVHVLGPKVWIMVGRGLPGKSAEWRALHARMIAAGAEGIITDRPNLVQQP